MKPILKVARKETRPFKEPVLEFHLEENSEGNIDLIVRDGEHHQTLLSIVGSGYSEKCYIYRQYLSDLKKYFYISTTSCGRVMATADELEKENGVCF